MCVLVLTGSSTATQYLFSTDSDSKCHHQHSSSPINTELILASDLHSRGAETNLIEPKSSFVDDFSDQSATCTLPHHAARERCDGIHLSVSSTSPSSLSHLPVYCLTDLFYRWVPLCSSSVLLSHTLNNLSLSLYCCLVKKALLFWRDSLLRNQFHLHAADKQQCELSVRQTGRPDPINQHSWDICGRLGRRFMPAGYWRASIRLAQRGWGRVGAGRWR